MRAAACPLNVAYTYLDARFTRQRQLLDGDGLAPPSLALCAVQNTGNVVRALRANKLNLSTRYRSCRGLDDYRRG